MSRKPNKKKNAQSRKGTSGTGGNAKKTAPRNAAAKAQPKQSTFTPWRFGFRYEITPDGRKILHRRKYVFEDKLKKVIGFSFVGLVCAFIVLSLAVIGINQLNRDAEDKALSESAQTERPVSLIGMTAKSRAFIEETGKFDSFMRIGDDYAIDVYDSQITTDDAKVLAERSQLGEEGIVDVMKEKTESDEDNVNPVYGYTGNLTY